MDRVYGECGLALSLRAVRTTVKAMLIGVWLGVREKFPDKNEELQLHGLMVFLLGASVTD